MRDAAKDRKVIAVRLQKLQIRGRCIFAPSVFREEIVWQQAQVVADREHPAWLRCRFGLRQHGLHDLQEGQRQCDSGTL